MMTGSSDQRLVSAVIIPAPPEVVSFAEQLRQLYGKNHEHVPPHITVLWPFVTLGSVDMGVDDQLLALTSTQLQAICQDIEPFSLTLDRYGIFGGDVNILYLALRDPQPFITFYERLRAVFPEYPLYGGQFAEVTPHLTLIEAEQPLDALPCSPFEPFTFTVRTVHFMYGDTSFLQPWTLAAEIPLGVR
ncbi:2'-5' RNA ligase family protein [Chloroflexota bacterium]